MPKQFSLGAWPPPQLSNSSRPRLCWSLIYHPCFLCFCFTHALLCPLVIANKKNKAARKCIANDEREVFAMMGFCWTWRHSGSSTMSAQAVINRRASEGHRRSSAMAEMRKECFSFLKRSSKKSRAKRFVNKKKNSVSFFACIESILHEMTQNG